MLHTQCLPFTLKTTCLIQTDGNYVKCTFFGVRAGPDFAAPNLFDLQWMKLGLQNVDPLQLLNSLKNNGLFSHLSLT